MPGDDVHDCSAVGAARSLSPAKATDLTVLQSAKRVLRSLQQSSTNQVLRGPNRVKSDRLLRTIANDFAYSQEHVSAFSSGS